MTKTSPMYPLFGILCALAFAFALSAFTDGCTKEVAASTPPTGWQCHSDGTCSRTTPSTPTDALDGESDESEDDEMLALVPVAPRKIAFELPEITIVGCVPVDEPGRVTFCEYEVEPIVGSDTALAKVDHAAVHDGVYPPALAE